MHAQLSIPTANSLRRLLTAEHDIVVIDESPRFYVGAGKTWIKLGERTYDQITCSPPIRVPPLLFNRKERKEPRDEGVFPIPGTQSGYHLAGEPKLHGNELHPLVFVFLALFAVNLDCSSQPNSLTRALGSTGKTAECRKWDW
jgi:hypothetical protein